MKWLIADRIAAGGDAGPWIGWGPYLWADGVAGRKQDGVAWLRDDLAQDGTHPADPGRSKVAGLLLRFFQSDPAAAPWFTGR